MISGAISLSDRVSLRKAEELYKQIRNRKQSNCRNVARNTGFTLMQVEMVWFYLFKQEHELYDGIHVFDEDLPIDQSWLRLSKRGGKNILLHDILLLRHELLEIVLRLEHSMSQADAHELAQSKYNYAKACEEYYV